VAWAAACAVAIGAYPLTYQQAIHVGAPPFLLFAVSLGVALPVQLWALGPRPVDRLLALRPHRALLVVCAVACAASFLLFLAALSMGGAGRLSALRNVSIAVATAIGWASGESLDARARWSAVAITLGAVAVSAG